jgi:hypothetical protein
MLLEKLGKTHKNSGSEASIRARLELKSSKNKPLGLPVRAKEYADKQSSGRNNARRGY